MRGRRRRWKEGGGDVTVRKHYHTLVVGDLARQDGLKRRDHIQHRQLLTDFSSA